MTNFKWSPYFGSGGDYVLDIVTGTGSTQMFLGLPYGTIDSYGSGLTQADADGTASALQSAVNALTGVTSSVKTAVVNPGGYILFDSAAYASYQFNIAVPDGFANPDHIFATLVCASPHDGIIASGDLTTVTTAVKTYMQTLAHVVSVTVALQSVVPATL